jgi:hypothetical protein
MLPGRACRAAARVMVRETATGGPSKSGRYGRGALSDGQRHGHVQRALQGIYTHVGLSGGHPRLETYRAGMTRAASAHGGAGPDATAVAEGSAASTSKGASMYPGAHHRSAQGLWGGQARALAECGTLATSPSE